MTLEIHASDAMREYDPILNYLPELIGDNPNGPIYFISPLDVLNSLRDMGTQEAEYEAALLERYLAGDIDRIKYDSFSEDVSGDLRVEAFRRFFETEFVEIAPDFDERFHRTFLFGDRLNGGGGIIDNSPAYLPLDNDITSPHNSYGILRLPYGSDMGDIFVNNQSTFDKSEVKLSSPDIDMRAAIIVHEVGHAIDVSGLPVGTLKYEVGADIFAQGLFSSPPDIPELSSLYSFDQWPNTFHELQHLRAIHSVVNDGSTHITNAAIDHNHEGAPSGSVNDFSSGQRELRDAMLIPIGHLFLKQDRYADFLVNFRRQNVSFSTDDFDGAGPSVMPSSPPPQKPLRDIFIEGSEDNPYSAPENDASSPVDSGHFDDGHSHSPSFNSRVFLKDDEISIINQMIAEPDRIEELSERLSPEMKGIFDQSLEIAAVSATIDNHFDIDGAMTYEVVRDLYVDGAFDKDPYAETYAYEFLVAVQAVAADAIPDHLARDEVFAAPGDNVQFGAPIIVPVTDPDAVPDVTPKVKEPAPPVIDF